MAICVAFSACTNDIETVSQLTGTSSLPTLIVKDVETLYSDSAIVKLRIEAPEFKRYETKDEPYDEYPQGVYVEFYNTNSRVVGSLSAEYAKFYVNRELWEASKNVEAKNHEKNEQLNTEILFWDLQREEIYSESFVRITTDDEVLYGDGFKAKQDLSAWKILKPKGTLYIYDEE